MKATTSSHGLVLIEPRPRKTERGSSGTLIAYHECTGLSHDGDGSSVSTEWPLVLDVASQNHDDLESTR